MLVTLLQLAFIEAKAETGQDSTTEAIEFTRWLIFSGMVINKRGYEISGRDGVSLSEIE